MRVTEPKKRHEARVPARVTGWTTQRQEKAGGEGNYRQKKPNTCRKKGEKKAIKKA